MAAWTSANLQHRWEAHIDGPKDDKDDITALQKFLAATISIVYHDFRQFHRLRYLSQHSIFSVHFSYRHSEILNFTIMIQPKISIHNRFPVYKYAWMILRNILFLYLFPYIQYNESNM